MIVTEIRVIVLLFLFILTLAVLLTALIVRWRERRIHPLLIVESLHSITDHLPVGMMLVDKTAYSYQYANPYMQRLFHLEKSKGNLPQRDWQKALEQDVARALNATIDTTGVYRTIALSNDTEPAQRFINWWVVSWQNLVLVFLIDVTERHLIEQNSQILLSGLAHELRTPLATIMTHAEILTLPNQSEHTLTQSIQFIKEETDRLTRLSNNVLALSRIKTNLHLEVSPLNLESLINVVCSQMQTQLDHASLGLTIEADSQIPFVIGNADYLKQVVINLLQNCIAYCRPNDQITIAVRRHELGLLCEVRDTGPGIDPKHLPHLTKRFYRAAETRTVGSGLGLSFVQEILAQHQSQLLIDSTHRSNSTNASTGTSMKFVLRTLTE